MMTVTVGQAYSCDRPSAAIAGFVVERAVADQGDHRLVRCGTFYSERDPHTQAESAAFGTEIASRSHSIDQTHDRAPMGNRFLDDDGVFRQDTVEHVTKPARVDGDVVFGAARIRAPVLP